jgi:nicotinate-nucleotide adenylyltransferase
MLECAVDGVELLAVDPREALRDGPSYTVDTLEAIHAEHPEATLIFCMGLDAFSGFPDWHRPERILELANLVVVERPGASLSAAAESLLVHQCERVGTHIRNGVTGVIARRSVTALAISATGLRADLQAQRSIRFLVPERVHGYIDRRGLYRETAASPS